MTIEDGMKSTSSDALFSFKNRVERGGSIEEALKLGNYIEGEIKVGGQEHFYLEPQGCIVLPSGELDEMVIVSANQNPSNVQEAIASVLGVPQHKIVCKVKRIGGGFGGKETKPRYYSAAVAVAARKHQVPIRLVLDRDVDMSTSGQRHPFVFKYRASFTDDGSIIGLHCILHSNAGWSLDNSVPVTERAMLSLDGVIHIPCIKLEGRVIKSSTGSNTAFRGFGHPQGMLFNCTLMTHIAHKLNISLSDVMLKNIYDPINAVTPYGQRLGPFPIQKMWDKIIATSNYVERLNAVKAFNREHKYKKRGISIIPNKYPIAFGPQFMNQNAALVLIYLDGSVVVNHGGVEMGQGLYTKMLQIASTVLGVPLKYVHTMDSSTDKIPNASPTAASFSSDLNGGAVYDACQTLAARLAPLRKAKPNATWEEIIHDAYFQRVNLSAQGFFAHPLTTGMSYDETGLAAPENNVWAYYSYGVAVGEVEVDCLTGDWQCLRNDILIDVGASLNPGLDVGQVEGAFTQGMGLYTMEELIWGDDDHPWVRRGQLFTRGPGTYKIPSCNGIF